MWAPSRSRRVKDGCDRLSAAAAIIVLSPLWIIIGALVWLTSPGPIIYRRRVIGLNGVQFDAFKFRTMVVDADRILQKDPLLRAAFQSRMKMREDPRLTGFGRWLRQTSLDELPQLFNVVRGEMSLVGPRMISPDEADKYAPVLNRRLLVKPGMTGLWQVSGRQQLDYQTRIALDMEYMENWSLWLDLTILLKTIPAVLSMRGAY